MNYREVLFPYQPLEPGDFMYRYDINNRGYIIYSHEKNKISCLELYDFTDISPFQLAVSIQRVRIETPEQNEFVFDKVCSKEDLLRYLFDIVADKTKYRKLRGVSNFEAYLLYHLKQPDKVRNIYQFNPANNDYQLVFDNDVCIASIFDEYITNTINVCWNPVTFRYFEEQDGDQHTSYLLSSSNPMLCEYICKKAEERKACIDLYGYDFDSLMFFSYFIKNKGMDKGISVFSDSKKITVVMKNWYPTTLVKFISKIQKIYNIKVREIYGGEADRNITTFQLISIASGLSFIVFSNDNIAIEIFQREVINEYKLNEISLKEI